MQLKTLVAIFCGGALGTFLRYLVSLFVDSAIIGTWLVNISGSFFLGLLTGIWMIRSDKEWLKHGLGIGLCGGFTTMSTFAFSVLKLLEQALVIYAAIYLFSSVIVGVGVAYIGVFIGTRMAQVGGRL